MKNRFDWLMAYKRLNSGDVVEDEIGTVFKLKNKHNGSKELMVLDAMGKFKKHLFMLHDDLEYFSHNKKEII